jgi:acyl-CoA reductase-like NAD-dependent aldehyde dehydrogenase
MTLLENIGARIYVGGEWRFSAESRLVRSPYDGQTVGEFAWAGRSEAEQAIAAGASAMRNPLPAHRRARILEDAARLVREQRDDLARLITLESGKPFTQSLAELDRAEQTLLFSATAARDFHGELVPMDAHPLGEGRLGLALRLPLGVVAAITPFNFPVNLVAHKIGPAFAAGCACVLKPADKTPLSALFLTRIFEKAGLPSGWLNTVTGDPAAISEVFLADERVKAISFTGSAEVGWRLRERAPRKKVLLELGNSTPLIVLADADLEAAARTIVAGGYAFSGQTCVSIQRVLIDEEVYAPLVDLLLPPIRSLRIGNPLDPETQIGPLITRASLDRILLWIDEAQQAGAELLTGAVESDGAVLKPVLLANASTSMPVSCREIFGPVVVLQKVSGIENAVAEANNTSYGLQASIFTRDFASVMRVVPQLDFGAVMVNESPSFRADQMPYGGNKVSGNTREGPAYAVDEFSQYRMLVVRYGS